VLVRTARFNLVDTHLDDGRDERVLGAQQRRQVDAERLFDMFHVRLTVGWDLLRAALVRVEPAVYQSDTNTDDLNITQPQIVTALRLSCSVIETCFCIDKLVYSR